MSNKLLDRLKYNIFLKMDIRPNNDFFFILLTLVTILVGIITNHFMEVIMYEVIMISAKWIRGYYCKYYILYIVIHIGLFLLGVMTLDFFSFDTYVLWVIQVWGLIITYICCPIQNFDEQLSQGNQKKSKVYSIIYILVYLCILNILYYFDNQYVNMILYMFVVINLIAVANEIENQLFKQLS